jgi:hypothetical protein
MPLGFNVDLRPFRGLCLPVMQRRCSKRIQDRKKLVKPELVPDEDGEESPLTDLDDDQPVSPPKKRQRKAKVVEPVVYDILPVESKTTTYRGMCFAPILGKKHHTPLGRLGYVSTYLCIFLLFS